jgi:hypothetical protein
MEGDARPALLISERLNEALRGLEPGAVGTLITLISMAAQQGKTSIPVSPPNVEPYLIFNGNRAKVPGWLAALRLKGLLRPVAPGMFEIAAGYWKVGFADSADEEFKPFP